MNRIIFIILTVVLNILIAGAQTTVPVSGTVKDATGEPLPGASVVMKGTNNGTVADIDGNFQLNVTEGSTLVISFVGFTQQEIDVNSSRFFNVILNEESQKIDEVVVIGYGTVRKTDATGSVTAIKPDELNKGLAVNPQDMLQGKVAGVNITMNDGTPGSGAVIRIRGGSSLNASNDPLIVIDGLPMDNSSVKGVANPLSVINPNDIETFTVLKDASATAIYGSRASNGVILITTKKGKAGSKPAFSYNGSVSLSFLAKRIEVMDAADLIQYSKDLKLYDDNGSNFGSSDTDWQKEVYRSALSTDHNLSITGGLKNMPYRVSLGVTYQDGIVRTSNMHRGTVSANVNPVFLDRHLTLNVSTKAMYIGNRWTDGDAIGASLGMDPTQPVYDESAAGKIYGGYYQRTNPFNIDPEWTTTYNTQAIKNPAASLEFLDDRSKSHELVGNISAEYKIHGFEDLRLNASLAAEYGKGTQHTVISPYSASNHYYGWDGSDPKEGYHILINAFAQYYRDFSDDFHFDIMGGYEYQHLLLERGHYEGWGMYPDTNPDTPGKKYNERNTRYGHQKFLLSFFGRTNLILKNKYLFTFTLRTDGSSNFRPEERFGYFPSAAFAWKINEEGFLKDSRTLSDLKLRLGYGQTGQQDIGQGDAPYLMILEPNLTGSHTYYPLGDLENGGYKYHPTYRPTAINKALTWETTVTYNAGIDFGFLKQRFTGAIDFYYRVTDNLISRLDIPGGTNFRNQVWANIGSLSNTGVEFTFDGKIITNKDFTWSLGFNATYNVNKIIKLAASDNPNYYVATGGIGAGTGNTIQAHKVGHPAWSYYVYETKKNASGDYDFVDRSGPNGTPDGVVDENDLYCYKTRMAPLIFGLSSKFNIGKFDINIALRANIGNYMYNDYLSTSLDGLKKSNVYSSKIGGFNNVSRNAYDIYWIEGFKSDNPNFNGKWYHSDYLVQNASFMRIDRITVGYNPNSNMRIYVTVQNPLVLTAYKGLDPEKFDGIDNNMYPRAFTTLAGFSYSF
jgi:iron complex outermembrane receptor protein